MGIPSAASTDSRMWVRGPTAQPADPEPVGPSAPVPAAVAPVLGSAPSSTQRSTPPAQDARLTPPASTARTGSSWPAEPSEHAPVRHKGHMVSWVSAHGGSGTSTLARVLGGVDVGRRWPAPGRGEPGQVLLVARTHAEGMRAASQALNALRLGDHPAGIQLLSLVLVADAPGRLPRKLGQRVRVMRSATTVYRVPWVPAWRFGEEMGPPPREVRALDRLLSTSLSASASTVHMRRSR
ncbi:DUF6668 family protein [Streptomyces sp. NPDC049744]|uniref:DUF6668 family protein n=1 Tax=Streptomyces sp. NPDC049744 TaxID=3154359 RepID=UPI0034150734